MKGLYSENFKSVKKVIEEHIRKQKDIPCTLNHTINIVKMTILLNAIYRFLVIPIQIPKMFFTVIEKEIVLQFTWI